MTSIRQYRSSDAERVAFIIRDTFSHFNKNDGTKSAVAKYVGHYDTKKRGLDKITEEFSDIPIFYVAVEDGGVVGLVRGFERRVINLFVLGKYHGKGIGKDLMERFESEAKRKGSKQINIRASTYAVPFYEHLGYKKTTGIRTFRRIPGLRIQPMRKKLR